MDNINNAFLEEFKKLDKLCREMYASEKGVTSYIDDMKLIPEHKVYCIVDWNSDLKKLINLRHIRNQLSHEVGTFDIDMCEPGDVVWLKEFYNRILNGTDPLSLFRVKLENEKQNNTKSIKQNIINTNENYCLYTQPQQKFKKHLYTLIDFLAIISIILLCLLFTYLIFYVLN
ncbi:MAG: hypothetical protein IKU82_04760 [Clostridia bacterium]|nr:hypothetical protein [Clostridia bacterium]